MKRALLLPLACHLLTLSAWAQPLNFQSTSGVDGTTDNSAIGLINTTFDAADPVNMATGEFYFTKRLLSLGGPLQLSFGIAYSSGGGNANGIDTTPQGLGGMAGNFRHSQHAFVQRIHIDFGPGFQFTQAIVRIGLDEDLAFQFNTTTSEWEQLSDKAERHQLIETATHYYVSDPASGRVHIFVKAAGKDAAPRTHTLDRNGNTLTYTLPADHDQATDTGPLSVADGLGRSFNFTYTDIAGKKLLTAVTDHTSRAWTFQYENDPADNPPADATPLTTLRSITDPLSGVCTFTYQGNNRISAKQMPEGNTPYSQTYSTTLTDRAVQTQTDALGRVFTFAVAESLPGLGTSARELTHPDDSRRRFFHQDNGSLMSAILDEAGHYMTFEADPDRRAIAKTVDRDGAKSSIIYDEASGFVKSITNARGDTSTATFTPVVQTITNPANAETVDVTFFDLTRIDHVDGTFSAFVFDTKGNATSSTDRDGDTTTRTFNARSQTLTSTNPETGVTTFTYDAAANLQTLTDSDTGVTTFGYDTLNRLTSVTHPDTSVMGYTYDALDRTLTRTDERGTVTKFDYDANSNLTALTRDFGGALEQPFAFAYDALDRLITSTDPAGNATAFEHPYFDSVSKITLPDGSTIRFEYDARRALSAVIDQLGHRTTFQRDEVEDLIATTTPAGRTLSLGRDEIGAVTSVTDPSGDTSTRDLDAFSRTTQSTDPLAREHTLQRDGEGRITGRDEPVSGGTQYEYDDNGRLTKLTDVRGKQWNLTYTDMGRLDTVTDPNAKTWDYDYDTRGRLSQITHPDTVVETRTYDAESHLTGRSFSDGLNLGFTYDALDRLKTTASTPVTLDYDSRGNLTTTTLHGQTFTAAHDSRNRLTTLDYAGQMTVTYTYDARGLVTRVTDSLTGAQVDLSYDADRLLTGITRSNGVGTTHSYDTDGKISQIAHAALGTIVFTYNAANEPTAITDTGFPVDGGTFLTSASVETQTFDDANQITTHTYDDRGRPTSDGTRTFTWDSADRLIGVGNGGSTLAYDYTATGQITSRTLNGQTTDYCYAYSVASQPILAERKSAAFTRFYVALPDGRLLYQIDLTPAPAIRFYHFGKVGETRFLTDAAGAVTDAYAYDGHGRLLGKTGASDQIYAFTGQLGVRHDPEANLVHMRARHYDPVSGRFLSRDPIHLALMGRNSQHANPYHFVEGMVTSVVDPSGLDAFLDDTWEFSNGDYEGVEGNAPANGASGNDVPFHVQLRREAQEREAKQNELLAMVFVGPGAGVDNQTFLNSFRQMAAFSLKASERDEVFAMLDQFASNPGEGTEAADYLSALFARLQVAKAENKAAAKALIRRTLGGFLRFVPLGGQVVPGSRLGGDTRSAFEREFNIEIDFSKPSGDIGDKREGESDTSYHIPKPSQPDPADPAFLRPPAEAPLWSAVLGTALDSPAGQTHERPSTTRSSLTTRSKAAGTAALHIFKTHPAPSRDRS